MTLQIDLLPKIQMPPLSSVSSSSFRASATKYVYKIRAHHPLCPSLRHSCCPSGPPIVRQDAPPARMGNLPLPNGKILFPAQGKFFLSPEKKFSLPSTLGPPSPSPACALQRHAPVPRHTATHARRRAMRKITTSHASATISHDDDTIKTRLTCMHKRLAPTMTPMTMTPMTMGFARNRYPSLRFPASQS